MIFSECNRNTPITAKEGKTYLLKKKMRTNDIRNCLRIFVASATGAGFAPDSVHPSDD